MAERNSLFGPLRLWIAPALGGGLVVAGAAMALGMRQVFAPLVAVLVAVLVLSVGQWRAKRGHPKP